MLHRRVLRVGPEPLFVHHLEERRGVVAAGVCEDGLAFRGEQRGDEIRERHGVRALVQHVGAEDEVEGRWVRHVRSAPVEEGCLRFLAEVHAGVVGREVQGCLVVVCGENGGAAGEGGYGRQPDAAPELDGTGSGKVPFVEVARQGDGARPQLGPIGEPLVAVEVVLVDQGVRGGGVRYAEAFVPDGYGGFGKGGEAAQVRAES